LFPNSKYTAVLSYAGLALMVGLVVIPFSWVFWQLPDGPEGEKLVFGLVLLASGLLTLLLAGWLGYGVYLRSKGGPNDPQHLEALRLLAFQEASIQQLSEANLSLRDSEEELAVTLNSIGDAVITTDAYARITRMNPVGERLTGWSQAEARGQAVADVFHILDQETRQPSPNPVRDALALGTIQGLATHTVLVARDGRECPIADSCAPIRDGAGQIMGAILVFRNVSEEYATQQALRDITARKQAEEALLKAGALQTAIFNSANFSSIATDARGVIQIFNVGAERMLGYSAAEVMNKITPADISDPLEVIARAEALSLELSVPITPGFDALVFKASRGIEDIYELTYIRKDGSRFPAVVSVTALRDAENGIIGYLLIGTDNTVRKEIEEERERLAQHLRDKNVELESATSVAEKANLAKSQFLSSMSHELRSPLNAILGFAQLMDSEVPPVTALQKANIRQILHAGWYLLELINEILDLAVIESGKLSLSLEPVSLGEVVFECQAMVEPLGQKRGITVTFPASTEPIFVLADRVRLKQVLINLLSNAIKYNRPEGAVVLDWALGESGRIHIHVRDTGMGLTASEKARLFQPFNRLGRENTAEEGTGIGLVMSKLLVELMGGVIGVESEVGVGSVFWFEMRSALPPSFSFDETEEGRVLAVSNRCPSEVRTLLYVEDNHANLELVAQLIARRSDLRMLSATDGDQGVDLARRTRPDVILMDINLPGMSGTEALKVLRADPHTAHIPVLAISANAMLGDIEKGMDAGFFSYLTKPINLEELTVAMEAALDFAGKIPTTNE